MQVENFAGPPGFNMASTLPDPINAGVIKSPDLKVSDEAAREAYERGGDAGMREMEDDENPYPGRKRARESL
ncbi:hypothetical protein FP026_27850 [Rhizobium tropici]|uniref:Uncharacterized protein n=1 Tax=Rhizobium tropici TaxID=398 RepID=A0A5B0VRX7_RHITR|nr:hypothetical protein [Rhizobium tropici]KAA1176651.1 hypothetical protein FP026_27850 [Rhizobium tropici]